MSTRRERRYQFREYQQRQQDFDNREIDPNVLANRREMMGLPDPVQQTPQERREDSVRRIQGEPQIGEEIARYLPDARDRSHLVSHRPNQGFVVAHENQERACLPNDNQTFRTNSGSTGCGLFTRLDSRGICCVQSDLDLLSSVAAIMDGKAEGVAGPNRIVNESYEWLRYTRPDLLPANKVVTVDTNNSGHMDLLKLGCDMETSCPFIIRIHAPFEDLPPEIRMYKLGGTVTITTGTNGASLHESFIGSNFYAWVITNWRKVVIDCRISHEYEHGNESWWVSMLDLIRFGFGRSQRDIAELELTFPPEMSVLTIMTKLENPVYPEQFPWVPRAGDGPTQTAYGRKTSVSYSIPRNTVFVTNEIV